MTNIRERITRAAGEQGWLHNRDGWNYDRFVQIRRGTPDVAFINVIFSATTGEVTVVREGVGPNANLARDERGVDTSEKTIMELLRRKGRDWIGN